MRTTKKETPMFQLTGGNGMAGCPKMNKLNATKRQPKQQPKRQKGQSLAEYGLILALIAVVAIAGLTQIGGSIRTQLGAVATSIGSTRP
jgi:pilus assembly protein Flp/PilA